LAVVHKESSAIQSIFKKTGPNYTTSPGRNLKTFLTYCRRSLDYVAKNISLRLNFYSFSNKTTKKPEQPLFLHRNTI